MPIGTVAHVQPTKEIEIAGGDGHVQLFVVSQILEIGFDQRMQLSHLRDKEMLPHDGAIDDLIEAGRWGCLSGGIAIRELRLGLRVSGGGSRRRLG